jgi:hypothetical protein
MSVAGNRAASAAQIDTAEPAMTSQIALLIAKNVEPANALVASRVVRRPVRETGLLALWIAFRVS